jgi:mannosyltransferase
VLVATVPVYVSQRTVYAKSSTDWSGVAGFVAANRGPRQAVYFAPRYPVTGPLVGQTARGVQTAYPDAFAGLRDLTLLRTPVQDADLSGTSLRLAEALPRLQGIDAVWVVRRNDYAYAGSDDKALVGEGFVPGRRWQGPLDSVIEFHRG